MLPVLILLCAQINPYGEAQAQIVVPSATGAFAGGGMGGALAAGALGANTNGTIAIEAVPGAGNAVNLDYIRAPNAGLDEDYRLAQLLIARTAQRRMEALRLQLAARNIEITNAQLREYVCSRFCNPGAVQIPATPMYPSLREVDPGFGVPAPIDPALYPQPLPYVPPRDDFNARYYIRHGGTVQVQVLPQLQQTLPAVYRRRY